MVTQWPLTGRTGQLEELGRHHRAGACGGVVLQGPAGVGKTRLAEEAASRAERTGRRVERAVGHSATQPIPLGAFAHLLPSALVTDLGVGADERTALFHRARAELRRLAGEDRLVLLVDDLDLLDDTSVAVVVPLIVSREMFLIGTVRTGAPPHGSSTASSAMVIWSVWISLRCRVTSWGRCCIGPSIVGWPRRRWPNWPACRAATCRS